MLASGTTFLPIKWTGPSGVFFAEHELRRSLKADLGYHAAKAARPASIKV
jgi:hypothetical protein